MIDTFRGFYKPTKEEFNTIWDDCIFVFDTNILLNFFRTNEETREKLLIILKNLMNNVFIPHQVAMEYHHRLQEEIYNQNRTYDSLESFLKGKIKDIQKQVQEKYDRRVNLKLEILFECLEQGFKNAYEEIESQKKEHPDLDETAREIAEILEGKVGLAYETQDELNQLFAEGKNRYDNNIPPGFEDITEKRDKKRNDSGLIYEDVYGDFLFWKQLINEAKDKKRNVILVTDDSKEDWWLLDKNKRKIAPHPHLIQEFKNETDGKWFYIYDPNQFIRLAYEYFSLGSEAESEKVIEGMEQVSESLKVKDVEFRFTPFSPSIVDFSEIGINTDHLTSEEIETLHSRLKWAREINLPDMEESSIRRYKSIIAEKEFNELRDLVSSKIYELEKYSPSQADRTRRYFKSLAPEITDIEELHYLNSELENDINFYKARKKLGFDS